MMSWVFSWVREHPVMTWYCAGVESLATTALPLSYFHPMWAKELTAQVYVFIGVAKETLIDLAITGGT